ncbi:hypothetical protein [Ferroplasma sp.]|uniref:hypothetical protein n=1 Tax=Ferroplasma sp. TaxID=2591003 RepID=UPI00307E8938
MDIKKYIRLKNNIETVAGIIVGVLFGAKFIKFLFPLLLHYSSSSINASTGVYAALIAIAAGVILFFGIRTLAYLLSSMFLGAGIGIALYDLTGIDFVDIFIKISHAFILLMI